MNQFCPKCQKWHDVSDHFCPNCNVALYSETDYNYFTKVNKKFEILPRKTVSKMYNKGFLLIILSIFLLVTAILTIAFKEDIETEIPFDSDVCNAIIYVSAIFLFIATIVIFSLGLKSVTTYNALTKVITHAPEILCPYCHSNNIVKIDTFDRAVSTVAFGLVSGKLSKQWHCNNCNSNF